MFERVRNLRFINRFGEEVVRPRRCYRYRDRAGSVAPLDVKLGLDGCFGFSPLMRWRPHDNRCVLRTRLALLNGDLKSYFSPPDICEIKAA